MVDTTVVTQAARDFMETVGTAAFGPGHGAHYLILAPKFAFNSATEVTYEVDDYAGMIVISPVEPPATPSVP